MVLEKIKYIQSEKDNELSYLNKELSSVKQKCSLLEMSVEDHQAESNRLKRELSEIEMAHKLEREKVIVMEYNLYTDISVILLVMEQVLLDFVKLQICISYRVQYLSMVGG